MNDEEIIGLYWKRNENAITETAAKYDNYCYSIAYGILADREDSKESVNDTYLAAWNSMPPHRPSVLSTFLGKITRRISIDRWRKKNAGKRGGGQISEALEELGECVSDKNNVEQKIEQEAVVQVINSFLKKLPDTEQKVFICRYWYLESINTVAKQFGFTQSKVKSMLFRTREKLRVILTEEGLL